MEREREAGGERMETDRQTDRQTEGEIEGEIEREGGGGERMETDRQTEGEIERGRRGREDGDRQTDRQRGR